MPARYIIVIMLSALLCAFVFGYRQGVVSVQQRLTAQALKQSEQARKSEKQQQERINGIERNYLHEIETYKRTINAYIDADNIALDRLSDTKPCPAVSGKAKAESGLVCYTPADLRKKVAESVAVGAECDQLAIRYKALVKAYQSAYGAKEE